MDDDKAQRMLEDLRTAQTTIKRATSERDKQIQDAVNAGISRQEIMEATGLGRTRIHQISKGE